MKTATMLRLESSDQGTFSVLDCEGFSCFITELPWRDNQSNLSCIPEGRYRVIWHFSPKFGWTYMVLNVPGRGDILIHIGNYGGDTTKGFRTDSYGCLLPATKLGKLNGQRAGLISGPAYRSLVEFFGRDDFTLEIKNAYDSVRPA